MTVATNSPGLAAALALGLLATPASAALTTYTDFASWGAATTGITTVTVPPPAAGSNTFFGNGNAGVTYGGVLFSTQAAIGNGNFFNVGAGYSGNSFSVLSHQSVTSGLAHIRVNFADAVSAFATNFSNVSGEDVHFLFSNGDSFTASGLPLSGYDPNAFFGGTSTSAFTSVLITANPGNVNILNLQSVSTGGAGVVPEPGAWALMILGFGVAGAGLRRRRPALA